MAKYFQFAYNILKIIIHDLNSIEQVTIRPIRDWKKNDYKEQL